MSSHRAQSVLADRTRALAPAEIAWIAFFPAGVLTLLGIALLGPPLGDALLGSGRYEFWPSLAQAFRREPSEQGRFLIALAGPLLLTGLTMLGVRRGVRLRPALASAVVAAAHAAGVAFVVVCVFAQRQAEFGPAYWAEMPRWEHRAYFSLATFAVAALMTAVLVGMVWSTAVRARLAAWSRPTRLRGAVAAAIASVVTVIWLLHAFNSEGSIAYANPNVLYHMQFTFDETLTILNGRSPLVDFVAQYGSLWPYPLALALSLTGASFGVFSALTLLLTGLAMLAIYAVLRRVARSPLVGLLLYLPFLASSFFLLAGSLENRYTFGTLTGSYPMRYAGPFVLAWLLVRHLDRAWPRQPAILFLAAGLVVLNNADAGIPAFGATIAALLWTASPPWRRTVARLAGAILAGTAAALVLVSALTLLRAGSLPHLEFLLRYARMFGAAGFGLLPMPTLGVHIVIYLTFVAAIGVATVRALTPGTDRALTGMLAFSGTFGLGAGAYYVGRSHPESLIAMFGTWTFALALLMVAVLRGLAARPGRLPSLAVLTCIFGFGVAACSLAQTPLPWQQLQRIGRTTDPGLEDPSASAFVAVSTTPGERVLVLLQLGHRIAENAGVVNVSPYTGAQSMPLQRQLDEAVAALRAAGGHKVFLWTGDTPAGLVSGLQQRGFRYAGGDPQSGVLLWIDRTSRR